MTPFKHAARWLRPCAALVVLALSWNAYYRTYAVTDAVARACRGSGCAVQAARQGADAPAAARWLHQSRNRRFSLMMGARRTTTVPGIFALPSVPIAFKSAAARLAEPLRGFRPPPDHPPA